MKSSCTVNYRTMMESSLLKDYPQLVELGFKRLDITAIAGSSSKPRVFHKVAKAIAENSPLIASLQKEFGFTAKNLALLLSRSAMNCARRIQTLYSNKSVLQDLIGPYKFSLSNVSAFLGHQSSGLGQAMTVLKLNNNQLLNFIGGKRFSANNLSFILGQVDCNFGQVVDTLLKNKNELLELIGPRKFRGSNLSFILRQSGASICQAIEAFAKNKDDLLALIGPNKFPVHNIVSILRKSGTNVVADIELLVSNKDVLLGILEMGQLTALEITKRLVGNNLAESITALVVENITPTPYQFFVNNPDQLLQYAEEDETFVQEMSALAANSPDPVAEDLLLDLNDQDTPVNSAQGVVPDALQPLDEPDDSLLFDEELVSRLLHLGSNPESQQPAAKRPRYL